MRTDTTAFAGKNLARSKRPRYVVELAFDSANTLLWYFTSHADAAAPLGASVISGVLEGLSGTSQTLAPDEATASIGAITFKLTDKGSVVTSQLGAQLALGRSTRRQRVRVYVGYEGLAWADYALVQTQLVTDIAYAEGSYQVRCMDVQREMRKDLFDPAKTTLAQSLSATATTVEVYDTSAFQMVAHGSNYSDAPNATVGYLKIQDERIRYTGKTSTQFTGCTRGALNTRPVEHPVDAAATPDRREAVEEYIYLEMPAVKLAYALLTGRMLDLPIGDTITGAYDSSLWVAGVTPTGYGLNQSTAGESIFAARTGPAGDSEVVNVCFAKDHTASADGGWDMAVNVSADLTKGYLFTCFFKRKTSGGQMYWGMGSNGATVAIELTGGGADGGGGGDSNPYFHYANTPSALPSIDKWYLAVGFLHPNAYGGTYAGVSGIYDPDTGLQIKQGKEYKFAASTTGIRHRAYHYYNDTDSPTAETQHMVRPRIFQCDLANAPALIKSVCNSIAKLPTKWHLGIDPVYVTASDFTSKRDLYDPRDELRGFVTRFEALQKTDGKKFLEKELSLLIGAFMPIYANGALGLRRMANILAGAGYVQQLGPASVVEAGELGHDFESLHNILQVSWNWEPLNDGFTRANVLVDQSSITVHGRTEPLRLEFRGLHGSRHSQVTLAGRFDALRDRYSGPPLRLSLRVLPSCNGLEVGDVVRVRLPSVRDFVANGSLDRSFEIQGIRMDWVSGQMNLDLFASSQAPGALAPSSDANVISDAWYTSQGTALSSALTITGSNPGHVSANGTLTGSSDMTAAPSIFYYNGDLQIDSGVTVNLVGNVQLRVKGFFQNNGTFNGKGAGLAGAAAVGSVIGGPSELYHYNAGTPGFLGSTEAGGGGQIYPAGSGLGQLFRILASTRGAVISGLNSVVPSFNLSWDGTVLSGVPSDLRGSSGSSGMPAWFDATTFDSGGGNPQPGGAGGAGGAGLLIISRGLAQGASAKIDLSGGDGAAGTAASINHDNSRKVQSGSGAGGAPGALLLVLDGAGVSATGLTDVGFVALQGKTPIAPGVATENPRVSSVGGFPETIVSSMFVGTGDGSTFPLPNLSGARGGARVQYVPNNSPATITPDPSAASLTAPSNIGLASGTSELLLQGDGTVIVRIKVTWTASPDARVAGYDLQFKKSADSIWASAPSVVGQASSTGWISGVQDAVAYDVRVRAGGATREVSDWVTVTNYNVIGKTAKPANVGTLTFVDPVLTWDAIADPDRAGYIVKYRTDGGSDWVSAFLAHKDDYVTATRFDTGQLVGGAVKFLVKARDTSKNESTTAAAIDVDLRPSEPATFLISRQPDGTRQFDWTHSAPSDLDGYQIRYYLGSTADWNAMTPLHTGLQTASPFETNQLSAGTYTFAIKSVDRAGNSSANAKFITSVTVGDPRIAGAIEDFKEEPLWSGTKTNCSVDAATGWLMADDNGTTWATLPATWAGWTSWVNNPFGTITYVRQIDIGVKTKFVPLVTVTGDGTQTIEEQHSDDNSTYSSYAAVGPQVDARYVRIRLTLADAFPKAKSMRIILSANPIEETIQDLATSSLTGSFRIGTGDIRLPITKTYTTIKSVHVALQNVGAGWSWELIDKTTTFGPRIKIYNAANALADATIDADITGI